MLDRVVYQQRLKIMWQSFSEILKEKKHHILFTITRFFTYISWVPIKYTNVILICQKCSEKASVFSRLSIHLRWGTWAQQLQIEERREKPVLEFVDQKTFVSVLSQENIRLHSMQWVAKYPSEMIIGGPYPSLFVTQAPGTDIYCRHSQALTFVLTTES